MKTLLRNSKLGSTVFLLFCLFFSSSIIGQATKTWVPTTGGNWTTAGNWSPSGAPAAGDHVIINSDQSAAITAHPAISLASLTVSGNCNLQSDAPIFQARLITVTGTFSVAAGKTLNLGISGTGRTDFTLASGAIGTINGTLNQYTNFLVTRTITINGDLTMSSAGLITGENASSNFTLASGATLQIGSTEGITTSGATGNIQASGTRTYSAGANYIYNGTAAQVTGNGLTQNAPANLTINNSAGVTLSAAPTISGTLAVTNGILDAATFQIIGNATNPFTLASGTTFRLAGAYPTLFTSGNTAFNAASTVEYYGATQTVSNTPTYGNLTITTAGTKTAGGALTVAGALTINTGATFAGSNFTHNVAGNWAKSGTFTANTSTINLNGNAQSITGSTTTFNNLTLATSTSTKTFGVATTISGNLTINTGVKADLGTFRHTSATLTLGGTSQGTGTSYGGTGSPAASINTTFFVNNTGYLNVGTCSSSYSLTSIAAAAAVCIGNAATINVTSTVGNLPNGTYNVFYTLGAPNAGTGNASMTVSGGTGSGSFTTSALASSGDTTITINSIRLATACVYVISSGNTATITVNPLNTIAAGINRTTCINSAITTITLATTGATGATFSGLPAGVTGSWSANVVTISGTPTASGSFPYTVTTTGGCLPATTSGTITVTPLNTIAAGINRTTCINSAITTITLATTGATGATFSGLPAGVTGSWSANVVTISGTPTASGSFPYTVTTTGGCPPATTTGTITVTPLNTIAAGINRTTCINSAITTITLATTGASGATFSGLPAGVTGSWSANVVTISGTPTASGSFPYTVTTTGGCLPATTSGTITVTPLNTIAAGTSQTVCINSAITTITLATTGATGATFSGLPAGVTGSWSANVVTISGTPTASGSFPYTVTTTGGCPPATTTGTITVTPLNTIAAGINRTTCINSAITTITLATTGATGATFSGLPAGVTGSWSANVVTISGTPTASGSFPYTVTTTGGCPPATATGTITVTPLNTIAAGTSQTVCINSAITTITLATTGATGATFSGLPAGVTGSWSANVVTISGTPTASGSFPYTVTTTGGCPPATTTGTITVTPLNTIAAGINRTTCINSAITTITLATTGATGATFSGLPAGVTGSWSANVVTISGTPTASGSFPYTVTTTGGCPPATATGTITVTPLNTIAAGINRTTCINSAITTITLATTGATGATFSGLPAGVTGTWSANVVTISGTPTASGTFNYTVTTTGGCLPATTTGTITVTPLNTIVAGVNRTTCINTAITNITLATTGATGATFSGLPAGVTGSWSANVVTISGTPTASGSFPYTVTTTGGCLPATTSGIITVTPLNTIAAGTSQTVCINSAITTITLATTGATGATFSGLPAGVTGSWSANVVTISGTPTASGTFNYTVTTTGGCLPATTTGTITVTPLNTIVAGVNRTTCINTAITNITLATTGATGATFSGLPAGVTGTWSANVVTISGTPTASGTFNYTVTTTGGCPPATTTGTITVTPLNTIVAGVNRTTCINTAITNITLATTGATGATFSGLPAGVTGAWSANVVTISGTPTASGTFNYTVTTTGGCPPATTSGTITVNGSPTSSIISGTAAICSGSPTNIQVAITGGTSPFTVVYTGGTASGYTSGSNISVAPTSTTTYTLTSVTDANGCVGIGNSGSAVVTIDTTTSTNGGVSWSNGTPSATKSVVFDGSTGTIGANFTGCSLRLINNATVTVSSGFTVTLEGRLTVDSGSTFTLNNNANLLQNNTLTNSGTIVVKRNSSALKRLDYTLWSSPVTGQGLYDFSKTTLPNRFYVYNTTTNNYSNSVGFSLTGLQYPSPLVSPNGINGTDSNNVPFAAAKGYLIRMPWDHPTTPTNWSGTFTGVPNNGDITYTMTNGGVGQRFNLVGNPYPSPMSMSTFVSDNNTKITGTLYFWRDNNNTTTDNAYCTWAGGTFTSNGQTQAFDPNGIIRTGQGFIVEALNASTTVDFKNGQRSSNTANQFFRTTNSNVVNDVETNRFWLNLTNATGEFSQMAAGYMTGATDGVDLYDGKNINTGDSLLNSILNATDYTIQGKALPFNPADVIPLSCKITTAGTYTIAIDHVDGLFTGGAQAIYLKDNLTATEHNLQTGAYNFTSAAGTFTNRFEIIYQSQLGVGNPTFTENNVIIYAQNNDFVVNTGNIVMASIKVFDIRGRLLVEKKDINAIQTIIGGGLANQVLLVQITSEDGVVVTKKVIR